MGTLAKYGIPAEEVDSLRILDCWNWLLGSAPWKPVLFSPFGDCFLESKDGHIHHLNILGGELVEVAPSVGEFEKVAEVEDNRGKWFRGPLVDQLFENGIVRGKGQIFGFRKLPLLGGAIDWENVEAVNPVSYHSSISQIHQQRKDLPTEIRISGISRGGRARPAPRKWWQVWK
jgi:hypothetical protein